jgi:hypothetical protein
VCYSNKQYAACRKCDKIINMKCDNMPQQGQLPLGGSNLEV